MNKTYGERIGEIECAIIEMDSKVEFLEAELEKRKAELFDLNIERQNMRFELDRLKREYKQIHSAEYYHPMDKIDIQMLISENGFIKGIKF